MSISLHLFNFLFQKIIHIDKECTKFVFIITLYVGNRKGLVFNTEINLSTKEFIFFFSQRSINLFFHQCIINFKEMLVNSIIDMITFLIQSGFFVTYVFNDIIMQQLFQKRKNDFPILLHSLNDLE